MHHASNFVFKRSSKSFPLKRAICNLPLIKRRKSFFLKPDECQRTLNLYSINRVKIILEVFILSRRSEIISLNTMFIWTMFFGQYGGNQTGALYGVVCMPAPNSC